VKKIFKIFLCIILCVIVFGTFIFLWKKSRPVIKKYEIVEASVDNLEKRIVVTGKISPRNEILIKPQMSGIIVEICKKAGDKVSVGDLIAKIKVIPDMVNLNSAESRVTLARLAFEQSKRDFDRDTKLYDEKVISKEDFDKTRLKYENDKEELNTAKDNLSLVRDGITSKSSKISNTLVRSTINGTILDIPVKAGNSVIQSNNFNDGTTIATVADMNDMLFVGRMDETDVGKLQPGMHMDITIGAVEDQKLTAALEYIAPKGTEENGVTMFELKAALKIPPSVFVRAGYSANAEILLNQLYKVLTLPEGCIEFSGDTSYVYVLKTKEPQTFEKKPVTVGLSDGIKIEIKSGLQEKEMVRGTEIVEKK